MVTEKGRSRRKAGPPFLQFTGGKTGREGWGAGRRLAEDGPAAAAPAIPLRRLSPLGRTAQFFLDSEGLLAVVYMSKNIG